MKPLDAHLELLRRLPVRTVSSRRKPPDPCAYYSDRRPGELRDREERLRLIRRSQALHDAGLDRTQIAEALNLCPSTVDRYVTTDISTAAKAAIRRL